MNVSDQQNAVSVPNVTVDQFQPVENGALLFEPLAPATASDSLDAQLSIDAVVRNNETTSISIKDVRLSYSGGPQPAPSAVVLSGNIKKICSGATVELATDPSIAPGQACRLLLLPDLKIPVPAPTHVKIEFRFQGFSSSVTVTWPLAAHRNSPAVGSYFFPAKATDLEEGEYWSGQSSGAGSHHRVGSGSFYAYDMGLARFDTEEKDWTNLHPNKSGKNNSDFLCWLSDDGQITRKGSVIAGAVSLVDLTPGRQGHVVASVRDSDSNLRLIAFAVDNDGAIDRVGTDGAGQINQIASSYINRDGNELGAFPTLRNAHPAEC